MFDYWRIKRCCLSYWYIFVAIVEGAPDQLYPNYGGYFTVVEIISVMFIITVITMLSRHSTPSASSQLSDPRQRGILSPKCAFHPCRKPWLSRLVWWKIFQNIGLSQMFPQKKKTGNEEVKLTTERTDLRGASFCYFREHFQNYY